MRRLLLTVTILIAVALAVVLWWSGQFSTGPARQVVARNVSGPLTLAAAGDVLYMGDMPSLTPDLRLTGLLTGATIALASLEVTLLQPERIAEVLATSPRPPVGPASGADLLATLGFNVVSRANNHGADYGADGIRQMSEILAGAGLTGVGAGSDLQEARAPAFLGDAPRRVAIVSVATSVEPAGRATRSRSNIKGRPGVSALRYTAEITVDTQTYETIKGSAFGKVAASPTDPGELKLFGTTIKKGDRTIVDFVADPGDVEEIGDEIRKARSQADVVVLALHSHEPSNASVLPADFVRRLARGAIDAGATLVVGHGPHQLRGVEVYKGGAILYSLGNFIFKEEAIRAAPDVFDAGTDLYELAIGAASGSQNVATALDNDAWWESVVAVATFENRMLSALRLHPLDLGVNVAAELRGVPRLADMSRGRAILERLDTLSGALGTRIQVEDGVGVVDLSTGSGRP